MRLTFNVDKADKKVFAKRIAEITSHEAIYQFTPTYAFTVGGLTVNRDATFTSSEGKNQPKTLGGMDISPSRQKNLSRSRSPRQPLR